MNRGVIQIITTIGLDVTVMIVTIIGMVTIMIKDPPERGVSPQFYYQQLWDIRRLMSNLGVSFFYLKKKSSET